MNREAWLEAATEKIKELLTERCEIDVPEVHISAGWPSSRGLSEKKRVVGECWKPSTSADGKSHIFISPILDDPIQILGTIAHELIHAWDKGEHGHRGPFVRAAREFGLVRPWTATGIDAELLRPALEAVLAELGDYPHSKITPSLQRKPQSTRMLKAVAVDCCGYIVRTTAKWLDEGLPQCPHGVEMEVEEK